MVVIKFICLLLAIWFTIVNTGRLMNREPISGANTFLQALGIAGFIFIQFIL